MFSAIRNAALAAMTAVLVLGAAGEARATILYSVSAEGPLTLSWSAPTFITPPTGGLPVDIPGVLSCTLLGAPCPNPPQLLFQAGTPPVVPDSIDVEVWSGVLGYGALFLPSDFGAVGTYSDFIDPTRGTMTVSEVSAVPEPASLPLLALGLAGLGMVLRTRRV